MRLLNRYVTGLYLAATGIFLLTLMALFLLVDFVSKAGLFFSLKQVSILPFLFHYYALRLPTMMLYVLPMVTLFGAVFTLLRLSKANELVPIVTSGMSMRRMTTPFLVGAFLCGGVIALLDEVVIPSVADEFLELDSVLTSKEISYSVIAYDEHGEHFYASSYNHVKHRAHSVTLARYVPPNIIRYSIKARTAEWSEERKTWIFRNGTLQKYDANGDPIYVRKGSDRPVVDIRRFGRKGFSHKMHITPDDLRRTSFLTVQSVTMPELLQLMEKHPEIRAHRQRFHSKLTFPLSPMILLLVGVPFVVAVGTRGVVRGLSLCLLVSMGYYVTHFVCADLGHRGAMAPELAAWIPTAAFGLLGGILFSRMRT